ncbi:MAG: phosphate/phosphite/phosphonate ABC transporter substrate-binding protein [Candidatus Thiodiazotropha sp.]
MVRDIGKGTALLLFLLFCLPPFYVAASSSDPDTLVIGKISHNPKKHYRYLKPMLMYVVERMHDLGIRKGKVRMAKSKEHMAELLARGEVDWVTETPIAAAYLHEKSDAELLLRKWKKGAPEYYTVFFSLKNGAVNKLEDLKGKIIALEDPASTTAYYLPIYAMLQNGLMPVALNSFRDSPPANKVGFVFVREEINIATLVNKGMAHAGAFSNLDWDKEDHLPSQYRDQFSIFQTLPPVIRAVEMVRRDMSPTLKGRLEEILLKADDDPKALPILRAYQRTKKFDALSDKQKQSIYDMYSIVDRVDHALTP